MILLFPLLCCRCQRHLLFYPTLRLPTTHSEELCQESWSAYVHQWPGCPLTCKPAQRCNVPVCKWATSAAPLTRAVLSCHPASTAPFWTTGSGSPLRDYCSHSAHSSHSLFPPTNCYPRAKIMDRAYCLPGVLDSLPPSISWLMWGQTRQ